MQKWRLIRKEDDRGNVSFDVYDVATMALVASRILSRDEGTLIITAHELLAAVEHAERFLRAKKRRGRTELIEELRVARIRASPMPITK